MDIIWQKSFRHDEANNEWLFKRLSGSMHLFDLKAGIVSIPIMGG